MIVKIFLITFHLIDCVNSRDAPPIMIPDQGSVIGTYIKMYRTQNIIGYLGIPYAQPPINERRFAPPVVDNLPNWDMVRNATFFQPDCWQTSTRPLKKHDEHFMNLINELRSLDPNMKTYDEDCLFLNIFIPDAPPPMEGYAVIAWLHSGDFSYGSAADLDPFQLVFKQKVIVVTIAYRLNIFGFLTSMDGESPGNFGLMDQSAALLWIRRNIKLFGGNDNSITLMGHGSGAISASLHLTSGDWTDGLFHKAIIMSGSSLSDSAVRDPMIYKTTLDMVAHSFGCFRRPTSKLLECLRRISAKTLASNLPYTEWGPIMDLGLSNTTSPFIPDYPRLLFERGLFRQVPLIIGFTDMEDVLDILMGDMIENGITNEMYETLITDIIVNELSYLETNDSCGGNIQIVTDAVEYAYKPYLPITDTMLLRKMFIDFNTERKYNAPSLLLASYMSRHTTTYVYRFDIKSMTPIVQNSLPEWIGVPHNFDLIFIWGIPYWSNSDMTNSWGTTDKRASDILMTLWTNFVKYSNPTRMGVYITWNQFFYDKQQILIIDRFFNMSDEKSININSIKFWNDYYPRVVQHATLCCNGTNSGTHLGNIENTKNVHIIVSFFYICIFTIMFSNKINFLA